MEHTKKTYQPKQGDIKREWHLRDAKGIVLGRLATDCTRLLMGKHKKTYSAHMDSGDHVVVVNAQEVRVTGNKESQKVYYHHSGYPGGLKATSFRQLKEKSPAKIIEHAVYNMLPKNRLRDERMTRLKVFAGSENPYKDKLKISSANL